MTKQRKSSDLKNKASGPLKRTIHGRICIRYFAHITKYLAQNWDQIFAAFLEITKPPESPTRKKMKSRTPVFLQLSQEYTTWINRKTKALTWEHKPSLKRFSTIDDLHEHYKKRKLEDFPPRLIIPTGQIRRQKSWDIIRGYFSQDSFSASGNQCTAIAVTSIVWATQFGLSTFTRDTIDQILWLGKDYYSICRRRAAVKKWITGYGSGVLDILAGDYPHRLETSLEKFWESEYLYAIVTINNKSMAIAKDGEFFYVFDSHSNDKNGKYYPDNTEIGTACIKKYYPSVCRFRDISDDLHSNNSPVEEPENFDNLGVGEDLPFLYSITPVMVTSTEREPPCQQNPAGG
ncbi:unnamed protein product [Allacma fusca]|uniref:Uncharacterized protein n=1 Tax=Allacma fusca TaxID=39272 RepID=A0A8J2KD14_9HEXA|nr:unnamed protein product [Allacma fusca]